MLVPADRARQALWSELDAASNILLPSMSRLARYGLRSSKRERREFHRLAEQVDLQPLAFSRPGGQFSGGNQQKLVIARWLGRSRELRVLLLDELTQGVDVGARRKIYETLYALAAEGSQCCSHRQTLRKSHSWPTALWSSTAVWSAVSWQMTN